MASQTWQELVGEGRQTVEEREEEENNTVEEPMERRREVEAARAEDARRVFWQLREIELEMRECRQERELQERRRVRLERSKNQLMRGMLYRRSQRGRGRRAVNEELDADDQTSTTTF